MGFGKSLREEFIVKVRRQKKILEIIKNRHISTQSELAEALMKAGFQVTQATVSRDVKELRLVKVSQGDNTYTYGLPKGQVPVRDNNRLRRMFREVVLSIDHSENLVVIRTLPGNAHGVASLIDGADWKDLIGTVAGDDTIISVAKPKTAAEDVVQRMRNLME
jgi:transcriptional regulator of arginine metabolism